MRTLRQWVAFFSLAFIAVLCASIGIFCFIGAATPGGSAGGSIILAGAGLFFCGISAVMRVWLVNREESSVDLAELFPRLFFQEKRLPVYVCDIVPPCK